MTTPTLYALTDINDTEGLEEDQYRFVDKYGRESDIKYSFFEGKWIAAKTISFYQYTHYLRPLPPGTRVLQTGEVAVSEEDIAAMAIEFHEWVGKKGYKLSHYAAKGEAIHIHESKGSIPFYELKAMDYCTTRELYNEFIQTKLAQMGGK